MVCYIFGEGIRKKLTLNQAKGLLFHLLRSQDPYANPIGIETPWDWQQPEGGICLVERLEDLENCIWLYPDGSVYFMYWSNDSSVTPNGPWVDGGFHQDQGVWDGYMTSWRRVYQAENAFEWSQLQQLLAP